MIKFALRKKLRIMEARIHSEPAQFPVIFREKRRLHRSQLTLTEFLIIFFIVDIVPVGQSARTISMMSQHGSDLDRVSAARKIIKPVLHTKIEIGRASCMERI